MSEKPKMGLRPWAPKVKSYLSIPLSVGLVIAFASVTPAMADNETDEALTAVTLEREEFAVLDDGGNEVKLSTTEESDTEEISVGYSQDAGATYVRTVNYFTGSEETEEYTPNETPTEIADVEGDLIEQEFLPAADLPEVAPTELELGTVIAVNSSSATLAWTLPEGADSVSVLLDGLPVENDGSGVTISDLQPDSVHEIVVGFSSEEGESAVSVREDTHIVETLPEGLASPLKSRATAKAVTAKAARSKAKAVRFVTFLARDFYKADLGGLACNTPTNWFFKGDNRTYSLPSGPTTIDSHPSMRTGLEVYAELDAPVAYQGIIYKKRIGTTKRYDGNKKYVDSKTADSKGIVVQNPTKSANNYVKFGVSHEVGDPYCAVGKIRYSLSLVQIYKSGTISISGSRQPIPTFEFYDSFIRSNGTSYWSTLYRGAESGLACLLGACSSQDIKKSATVVG